MINRLWLLAAFASAACAIAGCGGGSIATTRLPSPTPSSLPTLTPYALSTTIPLPAGAVPVTIALPTPAGGGNVIAGSVTFPAPTAPYGANAAVGVSVATNGSPAGPAASSRSRSTLDLSYSVQSTVTSVSLWWITPVTYPTAPTITISNGQAGIGYYFNWGYPALWSYSGLVGTGTSPLPFISGAAPITLPALPFVLSGTILQTYGAYHYSAGSSVTVAAGSSATIFINSYITGFFAGDGLIDAPPYTAAGCGSGTTATANASFGAASTGDETIPVSITGLLPGTCTMYLLNAYNFSAPVSVTVTPAAPVSATPSSVALTTGGTGSFSASQPGYTGSFSTSGCAGVASAAVGATSTNGSATITLTALNAGTCTLTVTGGGGQSTTVSVAATTPVQPVKASVASVTVPGAGVTATFTASQSGYTGAFTTSGCGSSVATASAGATANNAATITVTGGSAGGTCNLVVTGGQGQSVTIPVSVAITTVTGS